MTHQNDEITTSIQRCPNVMDVWPTFSNRCTDGNISAKTGGAPVAQWVKRWPADLAVPRSIPALGENLPSCKRSSVAHSLSLLSYHRPDITEILLKRT